MRIVWFTWKDGAHPKAGGAERVNEELASRLGRRGHEVIFLTSTFRGALPVEQKKDFRIIRLGGQLSVYWRAFRYYRKNFKNFEGWVIDEVNTIPFFANFFCGTKNILFFHQLAREVWWYELFFPLNFIGFILEPVFLFLLRHRPACAVSESTKKDLVRFGFAPENVRVLPQGSTLVPYFSALTQKFEKPTMLSFGAFRRMKRTLHVIQAFEIAKRNIPELELIIAGNTSGSYGKKIKKRVRFSSFARSIRLEGSVSEDRKKELFRKSHIACFASVREGWGLTATEAMSQGTVVVAYDVAGFRDSLDYGVAGILTEERPEALAKEIVEILNDKKKYEDVRRAGFEWSKKMDFEVMTEALLGVLSA